MPSAASVVLVFLVAAFSLPRVMRRFREWQPYVWPSLALAGGSIVTGFLRTGNAPGLGQRLGFACFLIWVAVIGHALFHDPRQSNGGERLVDAA